MFMPVSLFTLREHLSGIPDVRIVAPAQRDEDLGQFVTSESEPAFDAELVEAKPFAGIKIESDGHSEFTHFLDGAQRSWRAGFAGMAPFYLAHTSAGLLERLDRDVLPPVPQFYSGELELIVPEAISFPAMPGLPVVQVGIGLTDTETTMRQRMANAISARRESRETEVARKFRDGWLLVDGGIGKVLEQTPPGPTMVGVVKSHQRQYFASKERVRTILDLKPGERTPAFLRERNHLQGKEAYSFYLRIFDPEGKSPLFGLIRIELPPDQAILEKADHISGWLLAERDPLSLPDARFDRMLYPIRLVEKHLKARQPSDSAIRAILGI
jgi:hypothetical protein